MSIVLVTASKNISMLLYIVKHGLAIIVFENKCFQKIGDHHSKDEVAIEVRNGECRRPLKRFSRGCFHKLTVSSQLVSIQLSSAAAADFEVLYLFFYFFFMWLAVVSSHRTITHW